MLLRGGSDYYGIGVG